MLTRIATNYFVEDTNPRNSLQHDHKEPKTRIVLHIACSTGISQPFLSRHYTTNTSTIETLHYTTIVYYYYTTCTVHVATAVCVQ